MIEQIILEGEGSNLPHIFGGYTINHRLDRMEPERFVNMSHEGTISYYNKKRGFGFIASGKESYFFHFRGHSHLQHVFFNNEHKILFLPKEVCDSSVPKIDYPVRFILKKVLQKYHARMWVLKEEYDNLLNSIRIEGHEEYKVSIARKTEDGQRLDILVLFNGNNLEQLRERLSFMKQDINIPGTELYCEKLINGSYQEAQLPV